MHSESSFESQEKFIEGREKHKRTQKFAISPAPMGGNAGEVKSGGWRDELFPLPHRQQQPTSDSYQQHVSDYRPIAV
jgi:hypothetical protein